MTAATPSALPRADSATNDAAATRFVVSAVQAFARGLPSPSPVEGWEVVARRAGVIPAVADVLAAHGHELTDAARRERFSAAATSMRFVSELRTLDHALGGLRWVVLKGPVLADVIYRSQSSRTYDDLDVLVHPDDLPAGLEQLAEAGYQLVDQNWPMIAKMRRGEISLLSPTGCVIDLHWHVVNDPATRSHLRIDLGAMLRDAQRVTVAGVDVPSLGAPDLVVYVALHASLSGGHWLKWLLDIQQSVQWSGLGPPDIGWRARMHGLGLITRTMLQRVVDHVDPTLAPFVAAAARPSLWTGLTHLVSRSESPVPTVGPHRSGRSVFAATRRSGTASAVRLVTSLAADRRDRRSGRETRVEIRQLHARVDSPSDRAAWLAAASAEVR